MTKREIAALACKLLGIYALISALDSWTYFFPPLVQSVTALTSPARSVADLGYEAGLVNAIVPTLHIVVGLLLWGGSHALAALMVPETEASAPAPQLVMGRDGQAVAFSLLGLWTLLQVIPHLARTAATLFMLSQQPSWLRRDMRGVTIPDILGMLIQLLLGLWLLLGATGLTRLLNTLRVVGVDKPAHEAIRPS